MNNQPWKAKTGPTVKTAFDLKTGNVFLLPWMRIGIFFSLNLKLYLCFARGTTVHILLLLCRRTVLVHWGFASKPTGLGFFHVPVIILLFFLGGGVDYEDDISPDMFAACASFWHKSDSESSRWHCAPSDGSGSRSLSERLSRRGCKAAWRFRWTRRLRLSSL